jgi:hypothetical protein
MSLVKKLGSYVTLLDQTSDRSAVAALPFPTASDEKFASSYYENTLAPSYNSFVASKLLYAHRIAISEFSQFSTQDYTVALHTTCK